MGHGCVDIVRTPTTRGHIPVAIVTGSGGLIGSESVRHLVDSGHDVVGFENDMRARFFGPSASTAKTTQRLLDEYPDHFHSLPLDIRDKDGVMRVVSKHAKDLTLLVHAAAQPSHDWAASGPHVDFGVNANGTMNFLEAVRHHAPGHDVHLRVDEQGLRGSSKPPTAIRRKTSSCAATTRRVCRSSKRCAIRTASTPPPCSRWPTSGIWQNLANVWRSFEGTAALDDLGARLVLAGDGAAGAEVRAAISTHRVRVTGVLARESLERALRRAAVAVVAVVGQGYTGIDFNVPSKLMNFMGYGIPTVASVRADSEVARIIEKSGGGWVTDSGNTGQLAAKLAEVLVDSADLHKRGEAALAFAREKFSPAHTAQRFESALAEAVAGGRAHQEP